MAACDPGAICNGPLPAGDYRSETSGAQVEFTLDEHDWSGLEDTPGDGFSIFLADIGEHAISVVSFSGEIFADACSADDTTTVGTTPAEFMAFLAERHGLDVSAEEVEIGGRPALQVDLTVAVVDPCAETGAGRIWLWTLPVHGDFHFNDEERARVIAVDGGGDGDHRGGGFP